MRTQRTRLELQPFFCYNNTSKKGENRIYLSRLKFSAEMAYTKREDFS